MTISQVLTKLLSKEIKFQQFDFDHLKFEKKNDIYVSKIGWGINPKQQRSVVELVIDPKNKTCFTRYRNKSTVGLSLINMKDLEYFKNILNNTDIKDLTEVVANIMCSLKAVNKFNL